MDTEENNILQTGERFWKRDEMDDCPTVRCRTLVAQKQKAMLVCCKALEAVCICDSPFTKLEIISTQVAKAVFQLPRFADLIC